MITAPSGGYMLLDFLNLQEVNRAFLDRQGPFAGWKSANPPEEHQKYLPASMLKIPLIDEEWCYTDPSGRVWTEEDLLAYFREAVDVLHLAADAWLHHQPIPAPAQERIERCLGKTTLSLRGGRVKFLAWNLDDGGYEQFPFQVACYEYWLLTGPDSSRKLARCPYHPCSKWFIAPHQKQYCSQSCREKAWRFGDDDAKRQRKYTTSQGKSL